MGKDKKFTADKIDKEIINEFIFDNSKKLEDPETLRSYKYNLRKLSEFKRKNTDKKNIKELNEKDLRAFFNNNIYVKKGSWNSAGSRIIPFYRWKYKLPKRQRPPNLYWYENQSEHYRKRLKDPHRKKKLLIFPDEYEEIIKKSNDRYGQNKAIWELYYISGFRPEELPSMFIEDVEIDKKDNIVYVSCPKSKEYPRRIPLMEDPINFKRYLGNHPDKNNKKAPLFFNFKSLDKPLDISAIQERFRNVRKGIKETLVIKSFRKTRATIMFSSDDPEIKDYDNIGKYMGWSPKTVLDRAQEYKLTDMDDLKKALCKKPMISKDYDTIKEELEIIEDKQSDLIKQLTKDVNYYKGLYKDLIKRVDQRDEDFKILRNKNEESFKEISKVFNKTIVYDQFTKQNFDEYQNLYRKEKDGKLTKKEWDSWNKRATEYYNNYPNKIDFSNLDKVNEFRKQKQDEVKKLKLYDKLK